MAKADIGLVGLAVMGENQAATLERYAEHMDSSLYT